MYHSDAWLQTSIDQLDQLERSIPERLGEAIEHFRIHLGLRGLVLRGLTHSDEAKRRAQEFLDDATPYPVAANEIIVD